MSITDQRSTPQSGGVDRPRIFSHITKTRFLHVEDSLERRKLRFFIGAFEQGRGAFATAYTFLDVEDARVILSDLSWGKPVNFVDHKGGIDALGVAVARVLKIQARESQVWIQVANGPGQQLPEGAIKPIGQPSAEISIPLAVFDGRKLGFACLAYLQAWEAASFKLPNASRPTITRREEIEP
jgi:hypothetical protein